MIKSNYDSTYFSDFIKGVFFECNLKSLQYCILRNYEDLPAKNSGKDIDMIISRKSFTKFIQIMEALAVTRDFMICPVEDHDHGKRYFIYSPAKNFFLKLDIHFNEVWRGACYLHSSQINNNRCLHNGIYVIKRTHEAALLLVYSLLTCGLVKSTYIDLIMKVLLSDNEGFRLCLSEKIGDQPAVLIMDCMKKDNLLQKGNLSKVVKKELWLHSFRKQPLRQLLYICEYFLYQMRRRLCPLGEWLHIEILDPIDFEFIQTTISSFFSEKFPGFETKVILLRKNLNILTYFKAIYPWRIQHNLVITVVPSKYHKSRNSFLDCTVKAYFTYCTRAGTITWNNCRYNLSDFLKIYSHSLLSKMANR